MTNLELLKHLENQVKDRISYEEVVNKIAYISSERIRAYKRVLIDISQIKKHIKKQNDSKNKITPTHPSI